MSFLGLPTLFLLAACAEPEVPACEGAAFDADRMWEDVDYLASPALDGRYPGSDGDLAARALVVERFTCLGLTPLSDFMGYEQEFTDSEGNETANVIGYLPGAEAEDELVVVSAHLDHLGDGFLGANDNASGLSGLMAIARAAVDAADAGEGTRRTLVFAAFGSEELGFEGSYTFLEQPPAGWDSGQIVYNVNMDMIGSYDQTEIVYALGALPRTAATPMLEELVQDYPEIEVGLDEASDQSDNAPFCEIGIPYVFMWTEDPACYHERCDRSDRIDAESMASIASLTGDLAQMLADTTIDLAASVRPGTDVCGL
ncbi:MAG TPA: M28 family peptidase [Myxococcota bacterium]|nr:M28 family peptidase [Myxococcota bacterium]HNH47563.1 M28 family peptidase [Myxococcota bacterium]